LKVTFSGDKWDSEKIAGIRNVIAGLTKEDSGNFYK